MPDKIKHISFLCSRLDTPGGIEKAIVNTANLFVQYEHKVSIIILDEEGDSFFPLDTSVNKIVLNLHFGLSIKGNILSRKLALFKHIKQLKKLLFSIEADFVISTEYVFSIAARLAITDNKMKLISWEHHHFHHLAKSRFWKILFNKYYPEIDLVVCLNKEEADQFQSLKCKTAIIPNFIANSSEHAELLKKRILTIGWFSKTKGTDLISSIANLVFKKHPDWEWKLIGQFSGVMPEETKHIQIQQPSSHNVLPEYLDASIYVLPSRFECFPMTLLEAMSAGLPCVAFDCPTGPRHIIGQNETGILVPPGDVESMGSAISSLIEDMDLRKKLGRNAFLEINKFNPGNTYKLWAEAFDYLKHQKNQDKII